MKQTTYAPSEIADKIFNLGLSQARSAFENIVKSPIQIQEINYEHVELKQEAIFQAETYHVLKTDLIGDAGGVSFLIFNEKEIQQVVESCLPENFWYDDCEEKAKMRKEFVAEIDNILASSVVTVLANELDLFVYGGAPNTLMLQKDELNDFLKKEKETHESVIHFKAVFKGTDIALSPRFIWMFDEVMVAQLAKCA